MKTHRSSGSLFLIVLAIVIGCMIPTAARAEEEGGLTSEAAEQVFESVKSFMGDTAAMEKMSRSQKLDFVLTTAEDRIKKATADHFESKLKSELEDYAKKSLRAKAFLNDAVPLIRKAAMSGKPFDWSLIDANMTSKVDTQMAALTASISAAKTGYEVYQSFSSGGTRSGLESLGKAVAMSLVEAYVPGWGQIKVGAELVQALGDYVLAYASDTARAGMIADMYPKIKADPGSFARWILDKSPDELAKDVAKRWDDNAVEYGRLWKGKGTEAGAEEMKTTIFDQLLAMRSEVVLEQGRQKDLEYKLKEPLRDAQYAEYKLGDTAEAAQTYAAAALKRVREFKAKVYGLEKQDAQQAAQKVETGFAKAQAEPPGAGYEPLPRSGLASQLEAACSEIKDSYAADGYDFVKYIEALAGYADSRKAAIESNEQQVVSARNKAEELFAKAEAALKPAGDKLTELWHQKWALATGKHDASTGAQIDAIEKAMGPLGAQRDELRAQFNSEIAPLTQKAEAYAGLRAADLAALAAAENVVYLEVRDRNTRMTSALDAGLEDIQKRLDAAFLKAEEAVLPLNALDSLNYSTLSGSYVDLIKIICAIPASWDYAGSGVPQRSALIEGERRKVREDLETLRKLEPIQAKACGEHKQEVDRAREAFKALIAERFRKMYYNEANSADFWEGLYPPSIDKALSSEAYQRADSVSHMIPIRIFETRTTVFARQSYNCSRWKHYKIPDYVARLAELDKASQQMQPIIEADETARRLNSALGDLIETFHKYEPAKPGHSDNDQALDMYRLQEGKAVAGLDPLKSDGYLYLQDMKKVWAENKRKVETYEKLKKAYAGTIKYQYGPETTFALVDRLALIGQRIQAFEDALRETAEKNVIDNANARLILERANQAIAAVKQYIAQGQFDSAINYFTVRDDLMTQYGSFNEKRADVDAALKELSALIEQAKTKKITAGVPSPVSEIDINAVKDLYAKFKEAYESRNDSQVMSFMGDEWEAGDGTALSDLQVNLSRSFRTFDEIRYNIQNLLINPMPDGRFTVSYDVTITSRMYRRNLKHEEKSSVNEMVVIDKSGRVKISKTLSGRFWYIE